VSTAAIICADCGEFTIVDGNRDYRVQLRNGRWRPIHHQGECPKPQGATTMAAKNKTKAAKKAAITSLTEETAKMTATAKKATAKKATAKKAIEPKATAKKAPAKKATAKKAAEPKAIEPKATAKKAIEPKATAKKATAKKAAEPKAAEPKAPRKTIKRFIFGMLDNGATDEAICKAIAKEFPASKFNNHPCPSHLGWYRCHHAKRAAA
jgi:hypothetical protein